MNLLEQLQKQSSKRVFIWEDMDGPVERLDDCFVVSLKDKLGNTPQRSQISHSASKAGQHIMNIVGASTRATDILLTKVFKTMPAVSIASVEILSELSNPIPITKCSQRSLMSKVISSASSKH